jgi:hypothetical protein
MSKILDRFLKITERNGLSIWLTEEISKKEFENIFSTLPDPSSEMLPKGALLLKKARQRLVYAAQANGLPENKAVIKLFPLRNPFSRLKYKKYALREFINYHRAIERNVPVPKIYAYIEKRKFGFVTGSGIIVECLDQQKDLLDIAKTSGDYCSAAKLGIPALVMLYNSGSMHIDARDENIFVVDDGIGSKFNVIDWQYAAFNKPRKSWMLEHLAAFFIRNAPLEEQSKLLKDWLNDLYKRAECQIDFSVFSQRVNKLLNARQSVRARQKLRPTD